MNTKHKIQVCWYLANAKCTSETDKICALRAEELLQNWVIFVAYLDILKKEPRHA